MKRTRRSMSLFLGIWVAGSIGTYTASRHSVYAAGGQNDCYPCTTCIYTYNFFAYGDPTVFGQLFHGTQTLAEEAIVGPDIKAGNPTIYSELSCERFVLDEINQIDAVTFNTCTPDCKATAYPPPQGLYTGSNGQVPSKPFATNTQSWCNSD